MACEACTQNSSLLDLEEEEVENDKENDGVQIVDDEGRSQAAGDDVAAG
jgi:hypothetical protein